jgi:hypothetical protein
MFLILRVTMVSEGCFSLVNLLIGLRLVGMTKASLDRF